MTKATLSASAIIFDMDGLMLHSEVIYHQAWQETAESLGYRLNSQLYLQLVGRSNAESERLMQAQFGDDFPVEVFRTQWITRWRELVMTQGIPTKPGLLPLLDWLEDLALPKAVGTSSNWREAEICLKRTDLWHRFHPIITIDQVQAGKPAPDIFLRAAEQLGYAPQDCLVLEDSNAGVKAAANAGIPVVMVPDLQTPTPESQQLATAIFESLQAVHDWLRA
jgi:beta-phosphoglucomutase-like phosphatase (HAD superfamily)